MVDQDQVEPSEVTFRGVSVAELIGQPVVAIVKANHMMATEQVKLLIDFCFSKKETVYEPVMVRMTIRQGQLKSDGDKIDETSLIFEVPLITLLPITSLAIKEMNVQFHVNVHLNPQKKSKKEDKQSGPLHEHQPWQTEVYEMTGNIGTRGNSSNADNPETVDEGLAVSVSTHDLPLPVGITAIIQAYSKAIHPSIEQSK